MRVGRGETLVARERTLVQGDRLVLLGLGLRDAGEPVERGGVLRAQLPRLDVVGLRLVGVPLCEPRVADRDVGLQVVRVEIERDLVSLHRLRVAAVPGERETEVVVRGKGIQADRGRLLQRDDRAPVVGAVVGGDALVQELEGVLADVIGLPGEDCRHGGSRDQQGDDMNAAPHTRSVDGSESSRFGGMASRPLDR